MITKNPNKPGTVRFANLEQKRPNIIKVIGVGGGGGNAVQNMFLQGIKDVDFIVCNTDAQALDKNPVPIKLQLGAELTEGMGAGADPEEGRKAAEESLMELEKALDEDTKMVFITAGMGGGTGTGAAPVISKMCREREILTVGVVTMPFHFEGNKRLLQAEKGIEELKGYVDTLVIILNENLRRMYKSLTVKEAFRLADDVLLVAVKGMAELITVSGEINVDFKDAKAVLKNSGVALMGSAEAEGENRALIAVEQAINSPLQSDNDILGARNMLVNITGGKEDATIEEISEILGYLQDRAGGNANIIYGQASDDNLGPKLRVTVIVTGFEKSQQQSRPIEAIKPEKTTIFLNEEQNQKPKHELGETITLVNTDKSEEPSSREPEFFESETNEAETPFQQELFGMDEVPTIDPSIKHTLQLPDEEQFYNPELEKSKKEMDLVKQKVSGDRLTEIKEGWQREYHEVDYSELEKPAFERRRHQMQDGTSNDAHNYSKTTLSAPGKDGRVEISENRYLHRRVD